MAGTPASGRGLPAAWLTLAFAVAEAYLECWRLGLKGVSVHRTGSRPLGLDRPIEARECFAKCDPGACRL